MADISQIQIGGTTYDIKDNVARNAMVSGVHYCGQGYTHYKKTDSTAWFQFSKNQDNIEDIEQIAKDNTGADAYTLTHGDLFITGGDINPDQEYVYDGTTGTAERFGTSGTFGALAFKSEASGTTAGHSHAITGSGTITGTAVGTHNYTPQGTVEISGTTSGTFVGTEGEIEVTGTTNSATIAAHSYTPAGTISTTTGTANYTPEGSVSTPTINVNNATAAGTVGSTTATGTVTIAEGENTDYQIEGTVTLSGGSVSRPTFTGTAHNHTFTGTAAGHTHSFTAQGNVSTSVTNGTGLCKASVDGEVLTLDSVNVEATSTFTGTAATTASTSITPSGTISNTTATGTISTPTLTRPTATFTGGYIKATFAGAAHNHTFTGTAHNHTATATAPIFTGTGTRLVFTGSAASLSHSEHTHTATLSGNYTPEGTVNINTGDLSATFTGTVANLTHTVTQGQVSITGSTARVTDTVTVE